MAPSAAAQSPKDEHVPLDHTNTFNVFEGPEKKLEITFTPVSSSAFKTESSVAGCEKEFVDAPSEFHGSLRMLSRAQVQRVLDAAACTILSVTSNDIYDAYLLSESSLFVSHMRLMIKTCGTTTLLHALPVIMKLAYEHLGLCIAQVQFSRVSYLFPKAQVFPHNSFENEVSFLDQELKTRGQVARTREIHGSQWYMYHAIVDKPLINPTWTTMKGAKTMTPSSPHHEPMHSHVLEIYMFDLDRHVMNQFVFHDRLHIVGTDDPMNGVTASAGIRSLLLPETLIDAFNFEPCGYSMNALLRNKYYTIHVSPEPQASYVSFETSVTIESAPHTILSVVKAFKPSHFKIAISPTATNDVVGKHLDFTGSWNHTSKLLQTCGYEGGHILAEENGAPTQCFATVASYSNKPLPPPRETRTSPSEEGVAERNEHAFHMKSVAALYSAKYVSSLDVIDTLDPEFFLDGHGKDPVFIVDLGKILRNVIKLRNLGCPNKLQMRYAVRCNSDEAIIALLSRLNFTFEVSTAKEIELLRQVGVSSNQIVLVTPILSPELLTMLDAVGTVALFDRPCEPVLSTIKRSGIPVEVHVSTSEADKLECTLSNIISKVKQVASISIDLNAEIDEHTETSTGCTTEYYKQAIRRCLSLLPEDLSETITINVTEHFWRNLDTTSDMFLANLEQHLCSLIPHVHIGIEVSRLIVANSIFLLTNVIGRRYREVLTEKQELGTYHYYLNDGVYGAFSSVIADRYPGVARRALTPRALNNSGEEVLCTLFGPTCDALDCLWIGKLPVLAVGEWLLFEDMGAYGASMVSGFNGFARRYDVRHIVSSPS